MMTARVKRIKYILLALFSSLVLLAAAGCGGNQQSAQGPLKMASMAGMPAQVRSAPVTVQEAYQFAVANPDILGRLPCYCGCGAMGHKSNYDCYVAEQAADGTLTYDQHAVGCSICVDITQDAMRMLKEGKTIEQIRAYVDQTYAQYGPSNMP